MSYETTRDAEQLRVIEHSIDDFINRYNNSSGPAKGPRQTIFLFPGGTGSRLKRATTPYVDGVTGVQMFAYDDVWVTATTVLGGALDLKMTKVAGGKYRDKGNRIVVADGDVNLLGCGVYDAFTEWCDRKGLDWFVFGWDWRRRLDHIGAFFLGKFLPHFRARVQSGCNNADPLVNFSLIGHSAGGMVVNWILRKNHPNGANLQKAITVATPFYGYSGQVHRWFEGESYLNGFFDIYKKGIIKTLCSFPSCYAWQFLDHQTFVQNQAALAADQNFKLLTYPSLDKSTGAVADPYRPKTNGILSRYPSASASGFDKKELKQGRLLARYLASPLAPALAQRFVNIRGVTTASGTIGSTKWDWVPPTEPTPIADGASVPGDGTQPAWSARHVGVAAANPNSLITVTGGVDVEHMLIMNSTKTLGALASVLGV
jgi:hypothetical protein